MPFSIPCPACDRAFSLSEDVFQERVAGRVTRFKCPACGELSLIDANAAGAWKRLEAAAEAPEHLLVGSDFSPEEGEIDELSDEEVASLSPESLAALNVGRPPPKPRLESKIDDELWVVSVKEGAEDQEIFESSLIEQVAAGSMPPDAIVWREGMTDWLPLADVPELSKHLPPPPPPAEDKTGGFLGTGMSVSFGSNAGERKSAPPPLPPKKRSYGSAKKKSSHGRSGGTKPVALSPGLLFSVDDAESEPPVGLPEATKGRQAPRPPLKAPRLAVTRDLDFSDIADDDEEIPMSSGTPALSDLTSAIRKEKEQAAPFAALGGTEDVVLGPPSIDLGDIARPARPRPPLKARKSSESQVPEPRPESDVSSSPESSAPKSSSPSSEAGADKPRKKRKSRKSKSGAPPRDSKRPSGRPSKRPAGVESVAPKNRKSGRPKAAAASEASRAPAPEKPEQSRPVVTPVGVVLFAAIAGLAYLFVSRHQSAPPEEPARATQDLETPAREPQRSLEASRQDQDAVRPQPSVVDEPLEPPSAAEAEPDDEEVPTTASPRPAAVGERSAPAQTTPPDKPAPTSAPTKPEPEAAQPAVEEPKAKPKPTPVAPSNENLPPFDKAAAVGALNAAVGQASGCRQPGDPSGTARVVITFAPSGRVTSANLSGPPFAGTRTGGCIASTMRRARVPAFSGTHVTVAKSVVIR